MAVFERDPLGANGDDGFLQGVENTLHLMDHQVSLLPKFQDLLFTELKNVVNEK